MSEHILTLDDLLRASPPATPRHETREASAPEEQGHIPVAGTDAPREVPTVSENTFFVAPAVEPVSDPDPEPEYRGEDSDAVQVPSDEATVARKGFDIPTAGTAPTTSFPISTSPAPPTYPFLGGGAGTTFADMFDPSRRPPEDSSTAVVPDKQEAGTPAPAYMDTQSSDQESRGDLSLIHI